MSLLDTHVLVWAAHRPELLSAAARRIARSESAVISAASLWELITKANRPNPPIVDPIAWWDQYIIGHGVRVLDIRIQHVRRLASLPPLHKDPFDRILVCQAIEEGLTLLTRDAALRKYEGLVQCVW